MHTNDTFDLDFIQLPPAGADSQELEPELEEVAQIISAIVGDKQPVRAKKSHTKSDPPLSNRPKPPRSPKPTRLEEIVAEFIACPRCSYFAATYQVRHGQENWQNAIHKMENGWLRLNWGQASRHALEDAYGCRLDTDFYHYEGRCPDCLRCFTYREVKEEELPNQLWVQVKGYE